MIVATISEEKTSEKAASSRIGKLIKRQPQKVRTSTNGVWVALCVAAAIIVPQLTLLWRPIVGTYATAAALAVLLVLAVRSERARQLAIAAAILPVTLLVSLSLPQPAAFTQAGEFYSTILLLVILSNYTFKFDKPLDFSPLGKQYLLVLPLMLVVGELLGALGYGMLYHSTYVFQGVPTYLVALAAVMFAAAEELLFRGHIQQYASKAFHPIMAVVLTVVVYATTYIGRGSLLPFVFALVSGTALSTTYYFKQNLLLTTTANAAMKLTYLGLMATFVLH